MAKRTNFTWEDRKRFIKRLLPPENMSVRELANEIRTTICLIGNRLSA